VGPWPAITAQEAVLLTTDSSVGPRPAITAQGAVLLTTHN